MIAKMLRGLRAVAGGREVPIVGAVGGDERRRPWVLHPFLIGAFPVLSLYAHNVYEASPSSMAWPLAMVMGSTFVLWLALRLLSGDASRAGLATSLIVATFFAFKGIREVIEVAWNFIMEFWVYSIYHLRPTVLLGLLAIPMGLACVLIFRKMRQPDRWTRFLNAFTLILVGLPTVTAVSARMSEPASKNLDASLPIVASSKRGWTPDIYFIVLDGYARTDVMKDLFHFDNEPFLKRLENRGFFVARNGYSNYCQTRLSISSTLNANYLDKLIDPDSSDLLPISDLIRENLVRKTLRPLGYKFVSFATGFEPTDILDADLYLLPRPGNPEFSQILVEMTPLGAWLSEVKHEDRYAAERDRTLFLLDRLPEIAGIKGPTFTFAHFLAPHPPFVFGEKGEDVSPRREMQEDGHYAQVQALAFGSPEYFRDAYRKESAYLTTRIERTVEQIIASSPQPPVIILQSDHGSWLRYHPDDVDATDLRERFGILNCIYLPDRKGKVKDRSKVEGLDDTMTSVNTFRAVLKEVIGADLPLLPNRNIFSPFHDPLKFTDVTERLHSPLEAQRTFTFPPNYYGLEQPH